MSKYGTLVMGPAGAGKSTFCTALLTHLQTLKRPAFYVNLDPAAEHFAYEPDVDIKDLISLEDVMEEMSLGPNGGLIYCFEFLLQNLDFLTDALEEVTDEYTIVFDMPGQIELYTHVPVLPELVRHLTHAGGLNVRLCAAYLVEATFVVDRAKFFAATLSAMSAMLMLEVPHVNVLSKMDLVKGHVARRDIKRFLTPDADLADEDEAGEDPRADFDFAPDANDSDPEDDEPPRSSSSNAPADPSTPQALMSGTAFAKLNGAVARLIADFSMVSFLRLDSQDENSVGAVLSYIDDAVQYHEAQEPREPKEFDVDVDM